LNARWAVIAWTAFEGNVPLVALATHPVCPVPNAVGFARQAINVPGGVKGGLSSHAQLEDLVHQDHQVAKASVLLGIIARPGL
jgi:hypothetical protein